MATYKFSVNIKLSQLGYACDIDDLKNIVSYKCTGNLDCVESGFVYKIDDIHLCESKYECEIEKLQKNSEGKKYLEPIFKMIDGKCKYNNIINLKYKNVSRVLLKGKVILENKEIANSLIEVWKIKNDNEEILLGSTSTDEHGMFYINLSLNQEYDYKIVASYVEY